MDRDEIIVKVKEIFKEMATCKHQPPDYYIHTCTCSRELLFIMKHWPSYVDWKIKELDLDIQRLS